MKPSFKSIISSAALASLTAALINSILFFVFNSLNIIRDNIYIQESQPLTIVSVIISCIVPSLLAGVFFYLLCRYTKSGYRIFSIIAIILLILSFANPFMAIQDIPGSMGLALNVMHIVVVVSLLYFFKRTKTTDPVIALQ